MFFGTVLINSDTTWPDVAIRKKGLTPKKKSETEQEKHDTKKEKKGKGFCQKWLGEFKEALVQWIVTRTRQCIDNRAKRF